jgi:hypothetical protein
MIEPLRYAVRRLTGRDGRSIRDVARRSWVVHPAEVGQRLPAIFLPGQLERVEAVQEETSREFEFGRVLGGRVEHAATLGYELADAVIAGGSVFARGMRLPLLPGTFGPASLGPVDDRIAEASLVCSYVGNRYFAHWLLDDCPLQLLARKHAEPLAVLRPEFRHEADYARVLDLGVRRVRRVRVGRLLVFQDYGQNTGKRQRLGLLRAAAAGSRGPGAPPRGVYLRRGLSGVVRPLANEAEIEERLARRGFDIVDPETSGAEQILEKCRGVRTVVGVEGSQMAHGILTVAAPDGVVVALQPPWRFNNLFKDFADCIGFRYALLVGARHPGGFRVDADELERTLDLSEGP